MRRYAMMLIGALAVVLGLVVPQAAGQVHNGPLGGTVQNTERTIEGAGHQAAGMTGGTVREDSKIPNIPPPPASPQANNSTGNANAVSDLKQGSEARSNVAPPSAASAPAPPVPTDPRISVNVTGGNRPDQWRYRWNNGRWWYWTPQNRWMWYSDSGGWVEYDSPVPYSTGYGSYDVPSTGYFYYPSYGTYYYPGYGYGYGYPGYWYRGGYYYRPGISIGVGGVGIGIGGGYGHYGGYRR